MLLCSIALRCRRAQLASARDRGDISQPRCRALLGSARKRASDRSRPPHHMIRRSLPQVASHVQRTATYACIAWRSGGSAMRVGALTSRTRRHDEAFAASYGGAASDRVGYVGGPRNTAFLRCTTGRKRARTLRQRASRSSKLHVGDTLSPKCKRSGLIDVQLCGSCIRSCLSRVACRVVDAAIHD